MQKREKHKIHLPAAETDALAVANALGFNSVFVDESVLLPEESLPT